MSGLRTQSGAAAIRVIVSLAVLALLGLIAYVGLTAATGPMDFAAHATAPAAGASGADPTGVPAELATASPVARGQYLAQAADCESCHTQHGGQPFAGGRAFVLPFGTLYSPNITPDPATGIGNWSDDQFVRALHRGIAADGTRLYPAFPYAAYSYLSDSDVIAIKAYLFSLPVVRSVAPANTLAFPFNQRWLMAIWSWWFNANQRFRSNPAMSAQWNRGAYLAEALEHCGECHTPRNLLQGLNQRKKYAGAIIDGWRAYNITGSIDSGIGAWSDADLMQYLSNGHATGHGSAGGPMAEAVDLSIGHLTQGDIQALAAYVRTVPARASNDLPARLAGPAPAAHSQGVAVGIDRRGKEIFEGACVSCHAWTGISPLTPAATLTGARALNDPSAMNVVQIVLTGARRGSDPAAVFMPAFDGEYSDTEIAAVANYVVARFGSRPSDISAEQVAALRRQDHAAAATPHTGS
ncbi:MAG TPA: cytochrome c [Steroidobacteraceae bacterium]|nr:cytochrome c [Steroidobacteraceae bacterium]